VREIRSFRHAFRGVGAAVRERHMKVHLFAAAVVLAVGVAAGVTGTNLGLVVLVAAMVLAMEVMNSAVERICDLIAVTAQLSYPNEAIRTIKDMAAGAVLLVSLASLVVGGLTFIPLLR
jgi:diacylglycerol kinase